MRKLAGIVLAGLAAASHPRAAETGTGTGRGEAGPRPAAPGDDASIDAVGTLLDDLEPTGDGRARALARFHRALRLEDRGDNRGALAVYLEILAAGDYSIGVAERAATLTAAAGDPERALDILDSATRHLPDSPAPLLALSRFHVIFAEHDNASLERALEVARETARRFPGSVEAIAQVVAILRSKGDLSAAREFLHGPARASALADGDARRMIAIAGEARKVWPTNRANNREANRGQLDSLYEDALELAGEDIHVLIRIGEYFVQSGQLARAREVYATITSARPGLLAQRFRLADIRKALGDDAGHLADLESLVEIDPHNPSTHRTLSEIYRENGEPEKAVEHLQASLDLAPGKLADHLSLARSYLASGEYRKASRTCARTIAFFPDSAEARRLRALTRARLEEYAKAAEEFGVAEEMAGNDHRITLDADFYLEFGTALHRSGDTDRATEKLRTALDLVDGDDESESAAARIYHRLGHAWLESGVHIDQAGEMIRLANELHPEVPEYVDSLGWFRHLKGDHEAAAQEFERAWELLLADRRQAGLGPVAADAVILEHAARAKFALGRTAEALETLGRGLELAPDNESLRTLLAEIEDGQTPPAARAIQPPERRPAQANRPDAPRSSGAAR